MLIRHARILFKILFSISFVKSYIIYFFKFSKLMILSDRFALPGAALGQRVHRGGARAGGVVPAGSEVVLVQPVLPLQRVVAMIQ